MPIVEGENWRPINKKYHNSREISLKREDPDICFTAPEGVGTISRANR